MIPQQNTNYLGEATRLMTSSYRGQPNIMAFMAAVMAECQELEYVLWNVIQSRRLIDRSTVPPTDCTGSQLAVNGALVGQPNEGLIDSDYFSLILLRIACNKSHAITVDWSRIAFVLLGISGGPVTYTEGTAALSLYVGGLTLNPNIIAPVLGAALGNGIRGVLEYSTTPDAQTMHWAYDDANDFGQLGWAYEATGTNAPPGWIDPSTGEAGSPIGTGAGGLWIASAPMGS